jgi:hypothetical protein
MSYILNALKKAERDRKREESEDLDDFVSAGWDPYQEQPKSNVSYKIAAIILLIATLLLFGFYSLNNQIISDTARQPEPQQDAKVVQAAMVSAPVIEESVNRQDKPISDEPTYEERVEQELVQQELRLPEVTIAGHIYIRSGSPKNRIFIGDKTYYVGDAIERDWIIESINFDSLNIRSGALSSELPLR